MISFRLLLSSQYVQSHTVKNTHWHTKTYRYIWHVTLSLWLFVVQRGKTQDWINSVSTDFDIETQSIKEPYTIFSLIRFQEKIFLLCKEIVAYWHLEWRVKSHILSVCCYRASKILFFGSRYGRLFIVAHMNPFPSKSLAPTPSIKGCSKWEAAKHIFIHNRGPANVTDRANITSCSVIT